MRGKGGETERGEKARRREGEPFLSPSPSLPLSPSNGGAKLRALREQAGRTQLWVEAEAELGSGYLQRVESGKVAQPERGTLDRILTALSSRYSERRELLALFGYVVSTQPPDEPDVTWAKAVSERELREVPFPAFVLDCTHRLVAWNRFFPRLLGEDGDRAVRDLEGKSLVAAWCDPASPLGPLLVEPQVFLPAIVRAMRYEMEQFRTELWYARLVMELRQRLPRFRHAWAVVTREPAPASATRALVPMRLEVPGIGQLLFRLSSETFVRDARFRIVYYFPADPDTMRQCAAWASQETQAADR